MPGWVPYVTMFLLMVCGMLLIFIILLQRGRGGGLAGALGGMGGQSAFGTKAGDVFTKITIGLAIVWTLLAGINVWAMKPRISKYTGGAEAVSTAPALESTDKEERSESGAAAGALDPENLPPAATETPKEGAAEKAPAGDAAAAPESKSEKPAEAAAAPAEKPAEKPPE